MLKVHLNSQMSKCYPEKGNGSSFSMGPVTISPSADPDNCGGNMKGRATVHVKQVDDLGCLYDQLDGLS